MVNQISRNTERTDKDLLGGVYKIYLFPFVKYSRSQIILEDQKLKQFPGTDIYSIYTTNTNFTQNTEVEGGALFFKQNFSIEVTKSELTNQLYTLVKQNYRAIVTDNNGNTRMLGLWNGLTATFSNETGTNEGDFNGYRITFDGLEDMQAVWMDGFTPSVNPNVTRNFVYMDGVNMNLQDNRNFTLL